MCANTPDCLTHLVHPGQRAHVLPGPIAGSSERAAVPQGALLPQSVVQDAALLTPLGTEPVEIHGRPPPHPAASEKGPGSSVRNLLQLQLLRECGPAPPHHREQWVSKRKSTARDACGGLASATLDLQPVRNQPSLRNQLHLFPV